MKIDSQLESPMRILRYQLSKTDTCVSCKKKSNASPKETLAHTFCIEAVFQVSCMIQTQHCLLEY